MLDALDWPAPVEMALQVQRFEFAPRPPEFAASSVREAGWPHNRNAHGNEDIVVAPSRLRHDISDRARKEGPPSFSPDSIGGEVAAESPRK